MRFVNLVDGKPRFKSYKCAQEAEYKALVKAQEAAIAALVEGAPMGGSQTAAVEALKVR